ncbi:hypothetical protein TNCV_686071 [Trichonephila clavipes]|nr:hypothetical protein TNCV_686071 [Trichonephila clavipes]
MGIGNFLQSLTFQDRRLESGRTKNSNQRTTSEDGREKVKIKKIWKGCEESLARDWSSSSPPIGGLSYSERGWRTDGGISIEWK